MQRNKKCQPFHNSFLIRELSGFSGQGLPCRALVRVPGYSASPAFTECDVTETTSGHYRQEQGGSRIAP